MTWITPETSGDVWHNRGMLHKEVQVFFQKTTEEPGSDCVRFEWIFLIAPPSHHESPALASTAAVCAGCWLGWAPGRREGSEAVRTGAAEGCGVHLRGLQVETVPCWWGLTWWSVFTHTWTPYTVPTHGVQYTTSNCITCQMLHYLTTVPLNEGTQTVTKRGFYLIASFWSL